MAKTVKLFSCFEYKKQFLPDADVKILYDKSNLQLYKLEQYLKNIVIPVPPYRVSFNFLIFVTKGFIRQQLEGEEYTIGPDHILNIKQGSITRTLELSDDVEGFYIVYENDVISNMALSKSNLNFFFTAPYISLHENMARWLKRAFLLLDEEIHDDTCIQEICISLFRSILLKVIHQESGKPQLISRELEISYRFREYVQQNHLNNKEVLFYARKMTMSETYLNKCVKQVTGKPPKQWINEISILHSQILLQDLTLEITEIAWQLNYQSASYFTRVFKKVTGMTPSGFRSNLENRKN